jgi:hypothetical protein
MVLAENVQGRPVTVRLAVISGGTLYVEQGTWQGLLDVMSLEDGQVPQVRVSAEHQLVAWDEPAGLMYSDADQQALHPGDKFFDYCAQINKNLKWGAK